MVSTSPPLRLRTTQHPLLYEVNTRVLINDLSSESGKRVSLASIPDAVLDEWASMGFDAVWLMGVWKTGGIGREIAKEIAFGGDEYRNVLPDLREEDILGSPYAVQSYVVSPSLGGTDALRKLRKRLRDRGIGLILDLVSNHTARDHRWVKNNPELYVRGREGDEVNSPGEYFRVAASGGGSVLAFGRDPYFSGWTDTAQLNYFNPDLRGRMIRLIGNIALLCDGVRCDMAMLTLNEVFERTWKDRVGTAAENGIVTEFWAEAIRSTKEKFTDFLFLAESYWDKEWDLQKLGFDFTYDKRFYDRLLKEGAGSVFEHLQAEPEYQRRSIRFIENHDERRAADALPAAMWHCAAAAVMSTVPGMILFHDGQLDGRVKKLPVQIGRRPAENSSPLISCFYRKLLECLSSPVFRQGKWTLLPARPAWYENHTWRNYLSFWWEGTEGRRLIVVNYSPHSGQCYLQLPLDSSLSRSLEFRDLVGPEVYYRQESTLATKGMFFDLPAYAIHMFDVRLPA